MSTNDQFAIPVPARSRRYLRARRRPMVTGIHGMNSIDVGLLAWPGSGGHVEYPLKLPDNPERKNYDAKTLNRCGDYYYDMAQYRLAVVFYEISAEKGDHYGMQNLAWCFEMGFGLKRDFLKAAKIIQEMVTPSILDVLLEEQEPVLDKDQVDIIISYVS